MADDGDWDVTVPESSDRAGSGLEAFDDYLPQPERESVTSAIRADDFGGDALGVEFTVINPPGSASVTAVLGGRTQSVEIHDLSDFTETELAAEIVLLAELARDKAQAAQHALTVEFMRGLGHDAVDTSAYVSHSMKWPSPEAAHERLARTFADRYGSRAEGSP